MPITKLKFQNAEKTSLQVTTEDGSSYTAPWPCYTWHKEEIQNAIEAGLALEDWKTVEEIKAEAIESKTTAIKAYRDDRTQNGGFHVVVDNVTKWFHSDTKSRAQQLALAQAGTAIPENLQWKTMDGYYVTMTSELAQQIVSHAIAQESATYLVAETHLAALAASSTPEEYDFSANWPVIFGE